METRVPDAKVCGHVSFKSYYVVWKLKQNNTADEKEIMFKSYYVVWKPFENEKKKEFQTGLNRTM